MNNYISKSDWKSADGFILEKVAIEAVISKENSIIIAGPGAGKTELLAQRACYLLQTNSCTFPRKILAISFKKDAADNLLQRVKKRCGNELIYRFESMTYDAFSKGLLDRFYLGLDKEYQPNKNYNVADIKDIRKAFELAGIKKPISINQKVFDELITKMLSGKPLPFIQNEKNLKLIEAFSYLLKGNDGGVLPCLSFQMISRLAEYLIRENKLLQKSLQMTYSHVFLDEFQDTTDIQYELVKTCFLNSTAVITAVGDRKQRIMLWAGALDDIFNKYKSDFNAISLELLMNHRSAPRLIKLQKLIYTMLDEKKQDIEPNPKWDKDDGESYLHLFENYKQEAHHIAKEIKQLIDTNIPLREISILVKQLPDIYVSEIIEELNTYNIRARVETEYQDLLTEDCTKIIIHILYLTITKSSPCSWNYILGLLASINQEEYMQTRGLLSIENKLEIFLSNIKNKISNCKNKESLILIFYEILNFFGRDKIKSMFPKYERGKYLDDRLEKTAELIWIEYMQASTWIVALENFEGVRSIPIMTIHKSKGLEFDSVFFIGLEDAAFWNYRNQPEEDRCAFFVAMSRAKRRIDFTFSKDRPTRFNNNQTKTNVGDLHQFLIDSGIVKVISYDTNLNFKS